jgi:spore maturation protein A
MGLLFPDAKRHGDTALIAANIGANMLGLGNAATPLSIRASAALGKRCEGGKASPELCRLIVLNTASLQLLPMTVCSIRAGLGSEAPFDIVPAVWIASGAALCVGLGAMFCAERIFGKAGKKP